MKRLIQVLLFLVYCAFGVSWLAFAPLLGDLEAAFGISHAQAGLLVSAVSLAKAFVPLLAGLLASRFGLKRTLSVAALLCSLSVLVPLAPSFGALLALRFLFGVGGATVVTLSGAVLMGWFSTEELPMVNGLNNVAVNTGISLALFATVPMATAIGWRGTLSIFGWVSLALAIAWMAMGQEGHGADRKAHDTGLLQVVLRRRETWLLALAFTGPLALYLALNTWLPAYYQSAFAMTKGAASAVTGVFNLVGIPAAILGGFISGRIGLRRPLIVLSGLLLPVAAAGMVLASDAAYRMLFSVLLGASFFLYVSPLFTIPMELPGVDSRQVALMNGVVYSVAYTVSFVSPMVVGWLKDAGAGYVPGLLLFAGLSTVLAVCGSLLPETGPRRLYLPIPWRAHQI